jgi:hypothetical protein
MITQIVIRRIVEGEDTSYEIVDQNNQYLDDAQTAEEIFVKAAFLAETHEVEHVNLQVEPVVY